MTPAGRATLSRPPLPAETAVEAEVAFVAEDADEVPGLELGALLLPHAAARAAVSVPARATLAKRVGRFIVIPLFVIAVVVFEVLIGCLSPRFLPRRAFVFRRAATRVR